MVRVSWRDAAGVQTAAEVRTALRLPPGNNAAAMGVLLCADADGALSDLDSGLIPELAAALAAAGFPALSCASGGGDANRRSLEAAALLCAARAGNLPGLPPESAPSAWAALGAGEGARVACALARDCDACAAVAISFPLEQREGLTRLIAPLLLVRGTCDAAWSDADWAAAKQRSLSCSKRRYEVTGGDRELRIAGADAAEKKAAREHLQGAVAAFMIEHAAPSMEMLRERVLSAVLWEDERALRSILNGDRVVLPDDPNSDAYDEYGDPVAHLAGEALTCACKYGNFEFARLVVDDFGAEPEPSEALTAALLNGHAAIAEYLIGLGADPHECDVFGIFDVDCTRLLLDQGVAVDPQNLVSAVQYKWFDLLNFLLSRGVVECRQEALALAIERGMPEYIARLSRGAG